MARTAAPRLIGKLNRPFAWNLNRTAQVTPDAKGKTALRITVRTRGGRDWHRGMYIRRGD